MRATRRYQEKRRPRHTSTTPSHRDDLGPCPAEQDRCRVDGVHLPPARSRPRPPPVPTSPLTTFPVTPFRKSMHRVEEPMSDNSPVRAAGLPLGARHPVYKTSCLVVQHSGLSVRRPAVAECPIAESAVHGSSPTIHSDPPGATLPAACVYRTNSRRLLRISGPCWQIGRHFDRR